MTTAAASIPSSGIPAFAVAASPVVAGHPAVSATLLAPGAFKLPDGCALVQVTNGGNMAMCQAVSPPAWEKLFPSALSALSILISIAAFFVAYRTFKYNQLKDQRTREQSVQDDFWLRKVVSPVSIEPFLKFSTELRADLPVYGGVGLTDANVNEYWSSRTKKLNDLAAAFQSLELLDEQLLNDVLLILDELNELLSEYCGELHKCIAKLVDTPPPSVVVTSQMIGKITLRLFRRIQEHQINVGRR